MENWPCGRANCSRRAVVISRRNGTVFSMPKDRSIFNDKKRIVTQSLLTAALTLGLAIPVCGATKACTREDAIKAEGEASSLKTWRDVFNSYSRYWHCDDGAISEGYSSSIATLLASHWDQIQELTAIVREHPKFNRFILRHIDETMTSDQDKAIKENVRFRCSTDARQLCGAISKRLADLGLKSGRALHPSS
jgi:hypothetical protein